MSYPYRIFTCIRCDQDKKVIMNHDQLSQIYERCTDLCMWTNDDINSPKLLSKDGQITGFRKCLMVKKDFKNE